LSLLDGFRCKWRRRSGLKRSSGELPFKSGQPEFELPHSLACADRQDEGDNGQYGKGDDESDEEGEQRVHQLCGVRRKPTAGRSLLPWTGPITEMPRPKREAYLARGSRRRECRLQNQNGDPHFRGDRHFSDSLKRSTR